MIAVDEDALICDFAETYHIYDWRRLPVAYIATLAAGLREDSRIKMAITERKASLDTLLMAAVVDRLSLLVWTHSKDAEKGRNLPVSILNRLLGGSEPQKEVQAFASGADFERERARRLGKEA